MRAGNASPTTTRRRGIAALALVMVAITATGCYQNPDPTEWNAAAKKNFVTGCTTEVSAKNGTTTSIAIASKSTCTCIVELIYAPDDGEKGKYPISWDDLKAYESKQAGAKAGAQPPTVPKNLQKAIDDCAPAGPGL